MNGVTVKDPALAGDRSAKAESITTGAGGARKMLMPGGRAAQVVVILVALSVLGGGLWSPPLLYLGMLVAALGLPLARRDGMALSREPLFWGALLLVSWILVRAWINLDADASLRGDPDAIWHHIRYTAIVPLIVGAWLGAFWHERDRLFPILCVGVLLYYASEYEAILRRLPIGGISRGSYPEMGLISATTTVLCLGMALHLGRRARGRRGVRVWSGTVLASLAGGASLIVLIASQVRSSWLTMAVLVAIVVLFSIWRGCTVQDPVRRRRNLIGAAATVAGVALLVIALWHFIWWRLQTDDDLAALEAILNGQFGDAYRGSFAIRFRLLLQGMHDIAGQPFIGVGPAAVRDMLEYAAGHKVNGHGNYHSTYINLAVALGIPWMLLWVTLHVAAIARAVYRLLAIDKEIAFGLGLLGAAIVHFFNLGFQVRIWSVTGSAIYIVLMSLVFAVLLRPERGIGVAARPAGAAGTVIPAEKG